MHDYITYATAFVTVIYIVIAAMSLFGAEVHTDIDVHTDFDLHDGDIKTSGHEGDTESVSFQIINLKNILGFLVGFGWGTLIGLDNLKWEFIPSMLMGIGIGILIVALQTLLFGFMIKLEQKGIVSLQSAIGRNGTVYLIIHAGKTGKVNVEVNGSVKTLNATSAETLPTGSAVKITAIENGILVVEKR